MKNAGNAVTADDIRRALELSYAPPEWYIGFEVGNGTGTELRRYADAIAVNAYPSKGFEVRGFEIKVSKQDLKSELENGAKSDEIARYCDYWFLVVPKGLVDGFVLPPTWGVLEYHDGKLRMKTRAEKLQKTNPTPGFLCAMLRGRERAAVKAAENAAKQAEDEIRRRVLAGVVNSEEKLKVLCEKLEEIKAATGIELDTWKPTSDIIERIKLAQSLKVVPRKLEDVKWHVTRLLENVQEIQSAVDSVYSQSPREGE